MDPEHPVTIAKYADSQEASMAKALLESHGIIGTAIGGALNNALWHLGPTITGVELQVSAQDAKRATEILDSLRSSDGKARPDLDWICPQCGEDVDAEFDVCWSCGAPFDPTICEPADNTTGSNPNDGESISDGRDSEFPMEKTDTPEELEQDERFAGIDERINRAFRLSVLSLVFLPALPFALRDLIQLGSEDLSPWAKRKYYQSTGIVLFLSTIYLGVIVTILRATG